MPFVTFILGAFGIPACRVHGRDITPPLVVIIHRRSSHEVRRVSFAYNYPCWLIINII